MLMFIAWFRYRCRSDQNFTEGYDEFRKEQEGDKWWNI